MVTKTTALACAIFALAFAARAGSIDSDLIEAMKNAAETNKTVSREEWLEGIETLADSLLKSEAALSPDGGNEKIYFSGIKNTLTSGNEHKFIEDRLCELLKNGSAEIFGRDSDSPFPPEPESLSLKGSIENASAIIGGAKVPAYSLSLELEKKGQTVWKDGVLLIPSGSYVEEKPVAAQRIIVTGAIMKTNLRPMRRPGGFVQRPIVIINEDGVRIIPAGRHRMHPYSPRPRPIAIIPKPPKPNPPPKPLPRTPPAPEISAANAEIPKGGPEAGIDSTHFNADMPAEIPPYKRDLPHCKVWEI